MTNPAGRRWRRLRQASQVASLALFAYLFLRTRVTTPNLVWSNLFFRLDPLAALTATLAGRALIAGLALALVTVLVTVLFGRVWCGWLCPLGTVLEWLQPRNRGRRRLPPERWRSIKVLLLAAICLAAVLGNQTLLFFDPLTVMTRTLATAVWPALSYAVHSTEGFLYQFRALWTQLDWLHGRLIVPLFQEVEPVFASAAPILLGFLALVVLNWWAERFWCRYLCPLGGLLGLFSRLAVVRRTVGSECNSCTLCATRCPTGTIDPQRGYQSDPVECTVCFDCVASCSRGAAAFRTQESGWKPAPGQPYDPNRRQVLIALGTAAVGITLAGVEPITRRPPARLVRPPGAAESDFEALCIRCDACVRVCPTQGLQPTLLEAGWQNTLTPALLPRLGYCDYNCNACGVVCPTGAIPLLTVPAKQATRIGLARVDRDRCLPWAYSIHCIVCEEACPLSHKAIQLDEIETVDARGETTILQLPEVVKDLCIGCGVCEHQCPVGGDAAIQVFALPTVGGFL